MRFFILLVLSFLLSVYAATSAGAENSAYEIKQSCRLYGTTDLILERDRAKVDIANLGVQFIFVEGLNKIQIINLKQHKSSIMDLRKWADNGPPFFTTRSITEIASTAPGRYVNRHGLASVVYRGGPDKPRAFDPGQFVLSTGAHDVWFYSEATFCKEPVLSEKMNEFVTGLFRVGTQKRLYPLESVDFCQSGQHPFLTTISVKKIRQAPLNIGFAKDYPEVKLSDVMSSKGKDDFALELVKGFSLRSRK